MVASKKTFILLLILAVGLSANISKETASVLELKDTIFKVEKDTILISKNIKIKSYFTYIDSIVYAYDSLVSFDLSEHLLVRANPWIIDSLKNTDYYRMMEKDSFVYNQKELIILKEGSQLIVPDERLANSILKSFEKTLGWTTYIPKFEFTTDNAAMIAIVGYHKYLEGIFAKENVVATARLKVNEQ